MKVLNNWKRKRNFSNGLWIKKCNMFPFDYNYFQIGIFGFIISFNLK